MAIPASEAVVKLGSEGGAQTAREINQTAGAMSELGAATKQMTADFSTKPDVSGWADVGKQMAFTATETGKFSGGMVGLSKSIEQARIELGGWALALDLVPGLGLVEAATGAWTAREEALARHLAEKNKELKSSIELLEGLEKAGGKLDPVQRELLETTRELEKASSARALADAKAHLETLKANKPRQDAVIVTRAGTIELYKGAEGTRRYTKHLEEWREVMLKATLDVQAAEKNFANWRKEVGSGTAALREQERALQGVRDEHRMAREALELVDPAARYEIEIEAIERTRQSRLVSLSQRVADEEEYGEGLALINATAANKSALAWERETQRIAAANKAASAQVSSDWEGAAAAMGTHVQGFATGLSSQIGSSTLDAAASFKNMADQMVAQLIRVAVQMAIMKFIPGAAPVVSAAGMFQHGGMIPAPRGQAVNVIAHGGERIVSDTGRGAPAGGEGGGTTNVYQFKTGVLTPDSQRTMIRQISRTQRGTGERAFPR